MQKKQKKEWKKPELINFNSRDTKNNYLPGDKDGASSNYTNS
jgi:hypothetical protein